MTDMDSQSIIYKQKNLESEFSDSYKKDFGVFFTNDIRVVDKILANINFDDAYILNKKFLEPSCGNGIFIIRLLEKILRYCDVDKAYSFIENSVFFIDIEKDMVGQTRANISAWFKNRFGIDYKGRFNGFVYDFTKRIMVKQNDLFPDDIFISPLKNILNEIDYIIGNPPYVSLYGRRDRKKNEIQRIYYLTNYSQFPETLKNGKINYVMLFIEHSVDFLKEGGILSFIIDLSFFETAYEYTRKFLLLHTKIISIEINISCFDVVSGQLILTIQKEKVSSNFVEIINSETNEVILVDQKQWMNPADQYRFRFNGSTEKLNIINKISSFKFPQLKELYPNKNLRTCVMLLDMESVFVFNEEKKDFGSRVYPYYQGSKGLSAKFADLQYSKYFHYNKTLQNDINDRLREELTQKGIKNKKRLGLGETVIYDNPKIYIRQSAKEIIASYDEWPSAANNSLYVFSLRGNDTYQTDFLKFLCGYFNSDIATFYAQQMNIIRYSKGKQPQIKVSDLYTLPIPTDTNLRKKITGIVEEIYQNKNTESRICEINHLIYSAFDMNKDEIRTIQKSIESF
ncbi:MAG: N-6 DNA methylase [Tannerellaceae bacterium]|nr:N-6 DNA methylase [Tannerellaceae bacterium]